MQSHAFSGSSSLYTFSDDNILLLDHLEDKSEISPRKNVEKRITGWSNQVGYLWLKLSCWLLFIRLIMLLVMPWRLLIFKVKSYESLAWLGEIKIWQISFVSTISRHLIAFPVWRLSLTNSFPYSSYCNLVSSCYKNEKWMLYRNVFFQLLKKKI